MLSQNITDAIKRKEPQSKSVFKAKHNLTTDN